MRGAPLPSGMVNLIDGWIMLIGGSQTYNEVWFYHLSNRSIIQGPPFKQGRLFHACTIFQSHMHHKRYSVLVAGEWYLSMEVLDFSPPSAVWTESAKYDMQYLC